MTSHEAKSYLMQYRDAVRRTTAAQDHLTEMRAMVEDEEMMDSTHRPTDTPEYRKCPGCGNRTDWDTMIWLNGRCYCPACYERRKAEEKIERAMKEVKT